MAELTTCGNCNERYIATKPNKYCIECSHKIKRKLIHIRHETTGNGDGYQVLKRHIQDLPGYILKDLELEYNYPIDRLMTEAKKSERINNPSRY